MGGHIHQTLQKNLTSEVVSRTRGLSAREISGDSKDRNKEMLQISFCQLQACVKSTLQRKDQVQDQADTSQAVLWINVHGLTRQELDGGELRPSRRKGMCTHKES